MFSKKKNNDAQSNLVKRCLEDHIGADLLCKNEPWYVERIIENTLSKKETVVITGS